MPPSEPSLGRLLWQGVATMAGGVLKVLEDEALAERRTTTAFEQFLSFLIVLAVMGSSAVGLLLGCLYFFIAYADDFAEAAAEATMEEYDEEKGRMCVNRTASVEAPPTPEELRRAWEAARGRGHLAAKLLVGALLSDLEPAVDQSYLRSEDGTIVGRRPGLKGWLRGYCPELVPHYKALMSYKALADKLRIALGIEEPDTLSGVIDFGGVAQNGGEGAEDAAAAPDGGGTKRESLRFRKTFRLEKTNEQSVVDSIRSIFGTPDPEAVETGIEAMSESGEEKREAVVGPMEGRRMTIAKTSVFAADLGRSGAVRRGMDDTARGGITKDFSSMADAVGRANAAPMTMAALEVAVRERLGLCWMRRAGLRPRTA